jgi:exodeoxyribonuclease VII small subunit
MTNSIEEKINALSGLVEKIEEEGTSIDEAITLYSEAMTLAKKSFDDLDKIKQKITTITKEGESLVTEPTIDN